METSRSADSAARPGPARATPYLVVDEDVLARNIDAMTARVRAAGARIRPHVKTHKCVEIARRQVEAGAQGLTVATIGEAEVFAAAGFDDLFIAYPLWVDEAAGRRLATLAQSTRVLLGCDSAQAARQLAAMLPPALLSPAVASVEALPDAPPDVAPDVAPGEGPAPGSAAVRPGLGVLIEVDSGMRRSGVPPRAAGEVALAAREAGLVVVGVFTFPGHSYAPAAREAAAAQEREALAQAAASLAQAGVACPIVSGGSSPSLAYAAEGAANELRPGVCVVQDAQQWELGACGPDEIALTAHARVVSHAGGRLVLDAGSKILGADRPAYASGHGRLLDHPDARIVMLSEHHAVAQLPDGSPLPPLGSIVRVVPNHACNAINLVDVLVVEAAGAVVDVWAVGARGANG